MDGTATAAAPAEPDEAAARRARLLAYRSRARVHYPCGIRTNGTPRPGCLRCVMLEEYRTRRDHYLDLLERSDKQNEVQTPITPKVTFRWWLQRYQYPTPDRRAA